MIQHRFTLTRRAFVAGAAAAVAAPGILHAQARPWRYGHQMPIDLPIHLGVVKVAEEVQRRSNGRLRINVFPAGQLSTGQEMNQQVSDGSLDFAMDGPGSLGTWVRTLTVFEAPFISRDWDHLVKMIASDWGQSQFRLLATQRQMQVVGPAWYYGTRQLTTRDRAVRVPADARGLKIREPVVAAFLESVRAVGRHPGGGPHDARRHPAGSAQAHTPCLAAALQALFHLIGVALMAVILWASWEPLVESIRIQEYVGAVGDFTAPVWPVRMIMLIGMAVTLITFVLLAWLDLQRMRALRDEGLAR